MALSAELEDGRKHGHKGKGQLYMMRVGKEETSLSFPDFKQR